MKTPLSASLLGAVALCLTLTMLTGCNENKPDYQTQPPVSNAPKPRPVGDIKPANPTKAVEGSALNKIFPPAGGGYKVTYTQEKKGFAQAEVVQDGKKLATLSISDTLTNPEAKAKFSAASSQIYGYPSASVGNQGTAILVGDRFQVQVRSQSPALDAAGREGWIQKFNLDALKRLAGG
ncbi:MAG: hypothetical protein H7145_17230 [Akkermansiaceae bacterium]|nr:hypothetical protein [Armatimonadota bacterium]